MDKKTAMTDRQKRILIAVGIAALAIFVFVNYVYLPSRKKLVDLKKEYEDTQNQIAGFRKSIGEDKSLEQVITSLNARLAGLDKRLPDKEEMALREISASAEKAGLEISSLRPDKKKPAAKAPSSIKDCTIQEMPISVNFTGTYRAIGGFLKAVREDFPVPVTIETIQMTKSGVVEGPAKLNATLSLNSYLVIPAKE